MSDETLEGLLEPIPGDDPGGRSVRYEPVYDQIKVARQEDPVLPQGDWKRERKVADWGEVVDLATRALTEDTKDLQLAAWLSEAWLREEGFTGLERGLRLLIRLQQEFWDDLHPRIEEEDDLEFRAVPLEWIGEYLQPAINSARMNAEGHTLLEYREARRMGTDEEAEGDSSKQKAREEAIQAGRPVLEDFHQSFRDTPKPFYKELMAGVEGSREALSELDALGDEMYGVQGAPSYLTLRESLEEVSRDAKRLLDAKLEMDPDPIQAEGPAADESGAADGGSGTASGGSSTGDRTGTGGAPARIDSAQAAASAIGKAAAFIRRENPTNPAPYLLLRGLRWGELRTAGEIDPRVLEAPPTRTRTHLKGLLLDREWEQLVDAAEEVMATPFGRGWLDLQRYVVTALNGLGGDYDPVIEAVSQAIRSLLRVRPELPDLTLMDDSPTANRETLEWLRTDVLGEEAGDGSPSPTRKRRAPRGDPHQRALDRLQAGDPQSAVELLMDAASREDSARERFLRRSQATQIMVDRGMEGVALPILQEMVEQIERHSLEDWEAGDTVAQPLSLLYRSMERTGGDAGTREQLYLRVCRLDPMEGMRLKRGGNGNATESARGGPGGSDADAAEGTDGG